MRPTSLEGNHDSLHLITGLVVLLFPVLLRRYIVHMHSFSPSMPSVVGNGGRCLVGGSTEVEGSKIKAVLRLLLSQRFGVDA